MWRVRRMLVALPVTVAILVLTSTVAYASHSGPWIRAQYNNYTMCGEGWTFPLNEPDVVYGLATTTTRPGSDCAGSGASTYVQVKAGIWGNAAFGWSACGAAYDSGMVSSGNGSIAVNSWNDYCLDTHLYYTNSTQHGGWISGSPYAANHFPLTTPSEYF